MRTYRIVVLPGDGIGPEVMRETLKVLKGVLSGSGDSRVEFSEHLLKNQKEVFNDQKNRFRAYRSGDRRHV